MKSRKLSKSRASTAAVASLLGMLQLSGLSQSPAQETPRDPSWWRLRGAIPAETVNDSAVILQGQAKHVAFKAFEELEDSMAPLGGAGEALRAMITSDWFASSVKDTAPCQVGQLKTLAAPFYDRLRDLNIDAGDKITGGWLYPWTQEIEDDAALAPALAGQLKLLFSFRFDADEDGLPDWWEARVFASYEHLSEGDADGDGLSNLEEFTGGTEAALADSDNDGVNDRLDERPLDYDTPDPVERGEGLEVYGSMEPSDRVLAVENAIRRSLGLAAFESAQARREAILSQREVPGEE